jgi:hypothetical protein
MVTLLDREAHESEDGQSSSGGTAGPDVKSHTWVVATYRFRATFARRWTTYLSVILLIALTGGLAMASVAAARRTQSSYPAYLANTNPSTLTMSVFGEANGGRAGPSLIKQFERIPDVTNVRALDSGDAAPLTSSGAPRLNTLSNEVIAGSLDGYLSDQDRLSVLQGHLANPKSLSQVVMTSAGARIWKVHVGERVPIGFYSPEQGMLPGFGTAKIKPALTVHAMVTGIVALNSEIVQDDVDRSYGFTFITPAMAKRAAAIDPDWTLPVLYGIQLRHGDAGLANVETNLVKLVPSGFTYEFHVTSIVTSTVELAVKPESVALGAFGLIAALVCLILSFQALSRLVRSDSEDRRTLHSLGASQSDTLIEGLMGSLGALILGVLTAEIVAVGLSPLAPLGPVRPVYPNGGFSWDWVVLGLGAVMLLVVLGLATIAVALINSPQRRGASRKITRRRSQTVRQLQVIGLPVAPSVGVHFALESSRGRSEVPVRSILVGSVLAVTLMATTLTFASGLDTLISRPALYGWNWSYVLNPENDVPPVAVHELNHDHDVAAWTGFAYTDVDIDGQTVPMLSTAAHAKVIPPILSGHALHNSHQIVLGNQTMSSLHKKVGDIVLVSYGSPSSAPFYIPPTPLTIVGTATFPAVGYATAIAEHTSMGIGALLPSGVQTAAFTAALKSPDPVLDGPDLVFVRLRVGVSAAAGKRNLERIAHDANVAFDKDPKAFGNSVEVLGVQRPAQIVNYRTIGATPIVLATGLAAGAIVALALTLVASVRRRRRDLAILKTLGFTRRMLAAAISWQATVDGLVGALIGVPLGILLGRELWILFARDINAVPQPAVPGVALVLVGVGTLIVANLAAAWPGHSAARTSAGIVLRSE